MVDAAHSESVTDDRAARVRLTGDDIVALLKTHLRIVQYWHMDGSFDTAKIKPESLTAAAGAILVALKGH